MSIKLRRLNLPGQLVDRLAKKDVIMCKDVLSRSSIELMRVSDSSYFEIQSLIQTCSEAVSPKISNAFFMSQEGLNVVNYLPTSLPALDTILHGGLSLGKVTEITGPAGCGKTQFCLMLSALVASDIHGGVIYIDTEGAFSAQRLMEILQAKFSYLNMTELEKALNQVHVIHAQTCSSLMKSIESIEELVISKNVQLIMIDSVASLMNKEFSSSSKSIIERTNLLTKLASALKYTAEFFGIPVVVTNQTTTQFHRGQVKLNRDEEDECPGDEPFDMRGQGERIAALGNTWSHSVNTRLILQYLPGGARQILVAKSPVSPFGAVSYQIREDGLVQQGEGAVTYDGTDPGLQSIISKGQFPLRHTAWH